jgi:hypothetical protein
MILLSFDVISNLEMFFPLNFLKAYQSTSFPGGGLDGCHQQWRRAPAPAADLLQSSKLQSGNNQVKIR